MASQTEQENVHMGRQDFMSVVLRLIGVELYKFRRRMMSKVLGIISILAVVLVFLLSALFVALLLNSNVPQDSIRTISESLRLPSSLYVAVQIAFILGQILIVILVGAIVGGEYSVGTVRLMFTRGPSRTQFLISKIGAAITCIAIGVLGITLLSIVLGQVLYLITGIAPDFSFFSAAWLGHAVLYLLIAMLSLFVYAMMALCLATLGRSTAAGIAGALVWIFLAETVFKAICNAVALATHGATADFFRVVPNYFINANVTALQQNQHQALFGDAFAQSPQNNGPTLSDLHALLVLLGYLILFIGLSWWVNERRDVTN